MSVGLTAEADQAHIAEDIETLGASERRELESRLKVLLQHLLKWRYQPAKRGAPTLMRRRVPGAFRPAP